MANIGFNVQPVGPSRYEGIDLDHLILIAVQKVIDIGLPVSYENIVAAAFSLFPNKFTLIGYPEWPDGKRVHDAIFHCTYKSKQWLSGRKKHGYMFTEKGLRELERAKSWIEEPDLKDKKVESKTRREEKLAKHIEATKAYRKYIDEEIEKVGKSDLCEILQVTLDAPKKVSLNNLQALMSSMRLLGREDLIEFLSQIKPFVEDMFGD